MRQSLFALAATAFLLGACEQPQTSTPAAPPTTVKASVGSPVTPSGKVRIALLLPLSGSAAPIGQAMQQAAEMALFDTGAKELALAAYDSGESAETATEAYRKARTDGVALVLGPLFGTSAKALAPLVNQGGANVVSFSNDESAAQRGVWIMGIAAPPQVRRVVDYSVDAGIKRFAAFAPQTSYGEQMVRTLESHVAVRGGTVAGVELYDPNSADLVTAAKRLAERGSRARAGSPCSCRWRRPACRRRFPRWPPPASTTSPHNSSAPACGTCPMSAPTRWRAVPGMPRPIRPRRADFERRFVATYGRPPNRLATLAYDGVSLAGNLARLKPGGDFSAEAITNPNGWSGVDGIFRFLPDGRSERALAVIEVQSGRGTVVGPAPTTFQRPLN